MCFKLAKKKGVSEVEARRTEANARDLVELYLKEESSNEHSEENVKYYIDFLLDWLYIANEIIFKNRYEREKDFFDNPSLTLDIKRKTIHEKLTKAFETAHLDRTSFTIVATIFPEFIGYSQFSSDLIQMWAPILEHIANTRDEYTARIRDFKFISVQNFSYSSNWHEINIPLVMYMGFEEQVKAEPRIFAKYIFPKAYHRKLQALFKKNIIETGLIFKLHALYTTAVNTMVAAEFRSRPEIIDFINFSYVNRYADNFKPIMFDNAIVHDIIHDQRYLNVENVGKKFFAAGLNKRVWNTIIEALRKYNNIERRQTGLFNIDDVELFFTNIMHKSQLLLLLYSSAYDADFSINIFSFSSTDTNIAKKLLSNNNDLFKNYVKYTLDKIPPNYFLMYWHNVFIALLLIEAAKNYYKYGVGSVSGFSSYHKSIAKKYLHNFRVLLNTIKKIDSVLYANISDRLHKWHVDLSNLFIDALSLPDMIEHGTITNHEYLPLSVIMLNNAIPVMFKE